MKFGFKGKALLAAAALAFGGAAQANTNINASTVGSVFMNVVDGVTGLSFVYDTGLTQTSFNQNGFYSFDVSGDANYQAFRAAAGSNELLYNVVSADNQNPGATSEDNALTTIVSFGGTTRNSGLNNAMNLAGIYADQVNQYASPGTNSVYVDNASSPAAHINLSAGWAGGLQAVFSGVVGSALQFYSIGFNGTNKTSPSLASVRTLLAQSWNFSDAGVLSYGTQTAPVPLPAPLALLLGGLAMMGVVARRKPEDGSKAA